MFAPSSLPPPKKMLVLLVPEIFETSMVWVGLSLLPSKDLGFDICSFLPMIYKMLLLLFPRLGGFTNFF